MRYSLINVHKEHDGLVDGTWLQDCIGTLNDAIKSARATERVNHSRITVAVVEGLNNYGRDFGPKIGLKRLD